MGNMKGFYWQQSRIEFHRLKVIHCSITIMHKWDSIEVYSDPHIIFIFFGVTIKFPYNKGTSFTAIFFSIWNLLWGFYTAVPSLKGDVSHESLYLKLFSNDNY